MKQSLRDEWRYLLPAWLGCVLLPLPLILFWHSSYGRSAAVMIFFLRLRDTCRFLVSPGRSAAEQRCGRSDAAALEWKNFPLSLALLSAAGVFSLLTLLANDSHDFATPMLAFLVLVPALGIVPYMVLATRKPWAAVILSIFLVGSIKTPIGAVIIRNFFPSHFQQTTDLDGSFIMPTPWLHPNMLVWFIYLSVALLSLLFCFGSVRKFHRRYNCAA